MKIALIGDIHANLPALQAVLTHAAAQGARQIYNIGDFVGYGPFPEEVVALVQATGIPSIQGNYDRKTLQSARKGEVWPIKKHPLKWLAFRWAYDHLSPASRRYLAALPRQRRLRIAGWRILLVHGSPVDQDEHLTPETPEQRLGELAQQAKADVIVCGHSHQAFVRQAGEVWFINTGSVGRPDDGDPRAGYALLDLGRGRRTVQHYRLEYALEETLQAIRRYGLPEEFAQMFLQGRNLKGLQPNPPFSGLAP